MNKETFNIKTSETKHKAIDLSNPWQSLRTIMLGYSPLEPLC